MYARLIQFTLEPGQREFAEGRADIFAPVIAALKGHKSTTFMADFDTGEISTLTVWETEADAQAAGAELAPRLNQALGDKLKEPITVKILEVYEPKP
jgi:heme-degrading monooxygenase HmoA